MAPSRRSPKKLRVAKSPRTARTGSKATAGKPASSEGKKARPVLRTYDAATARQVGAAKKAWERGEVAKSLARAPARRTEFVTDSGIPIPTVVTPADRVREDSRELGLPGQFPYTRGVQPTMYRGRLWTMRHVRRLRNAGGHQPALQVPHDPRDDGTLHRLRHARAHGLRRRPLDEPGEVGKEGVAISTLRDFEILFDGIPLDEVTTSMTINASAIVALCMYIAVAEKQGVPWRSWGHHPERHAQGVHRPEGVDRPPRPAVRIVVDMIDFCSRHMPRWHPVSISGYHIREAGATAVQELAFTLADGIGYVEECVKRGMAVDDFAARLSFFWDVHNDFFEEIAKFRAARRIWAQVMRERFGARDPRSWQLRTHAQTAGVSLTAQQPYNNVVRTALQGLAAVLGGTQSLHTNSLDETYALPTEESVTLALRTQQLIGYESGVDRVVDPLGGSYYVEYLTDEMEKRALEYLPPDRRDGRDHPGGGGGLPQKEIGESAYRYQREVEKGERLIVGVNAFQSERHEPIEILKIDERVAEEQIERLRKVKAERNAAAVSKALARVEAACRGTDNLMPPVLEAVKAYATLGEISDVFRKVWGQYREGGIF
jgi:methylmalonyl-CoA mutase N-terminal domain/subunit